MKEKILLYSQLAPAEQTDIELYVARHPDLYPLLEEAKALGDVFKEAQRLHVDPPDEEVLAYYLVMRQMSHHLAPASLQAVFERIEARLQTDEDLRARYDRLAQRVVEIEAGSDTASHFERVTGHRLQPEPELVLQPVFPSRTPVDRGPTQESRKVRHRVGAVLASIVAVYLILFVISALTVPPLDDLAAFEKDDLLGMGVTRGATADARLADEERYEQALVLLREVRTSTLGLFPRYEVTRLQAAGSLLEQVATPQAEGSMLPLEATYLLAKVRLAQHNIPAARAALEQIMSSESGWRKYEAQALLASIPEQD